MVFWRIYKHHCRYQHNVEDNSELIDKACLVPHQHGFEPNKPVCIEFILLTKKWIDFKTIKLIAIDCVEKLANTNGVAADIVGKIVKGEGAKLLMGGKSHDFTPRFRESAYTPIKKLVGEKTPRDFDEMKEAVDKAARQSIEKKKHIIERLKRG